MVEDGEGDEAGEPEEHGQGVEGEHGDGVGKGGEEARRQGQVDEDEEGPDRGEDHEAVFRGGEAVGCDWRVLLLAGVMGGRERGGCTMGGETEDYEGEDSLDGA